MTTLPTDFLEQNGKAHVSGEPDPYPSSSDSLSKKSNLSNDSNSSKSIIKKSDKRKNRQKHKKQDALDSPSCNYDSSDDSEYIRKQHKKKIHQTTDPIKLCARLMEKLLMTAYKSKIIRFKLGEDPLQRHIYFLVSVE